MGFSLKSITHAVKNVGNAVGDAMNDPLKAARYVAGTTAGVVAPGYGTLWGKNGWMAQGEQGEGAKLGLGIDLAAAAAAAGGLGGASVPGLGTAGTTAPVAADAATTAGVMGSAGAGAGTDAVLSGGSGGLSSLLPKVGEYITSPGGLKTLGNVGSTLLSINASNTAAKQQADAAAAAAASVAGQQAPYLAAGKDAIGRLSTGAAPGGQFSKPFTMADAANSPAQQFALQQGMDAIQKSAAAKGGLLSTNAEQSLVKFAQDNAATYENQAFNQWLAQNQQQIGLNQSLAGIGQSGANQVGDVGANAALYAGGARAGAGVQNANVIGGALVKAAGDDTVVNSLSKLLGGFTGFGSTSPDPNIVTSGLNVNTDLNGLSLYSDERLKDDVRRVGYTDDGLPIFTYRMKSGGPKQMGVMAQHMEQVKPDAVSRGVGGFRMVDYDKVS